MKRRLSHGSTFSGIGAAEIAAEILGWDNKFHCEINDFGRKVLDFHFPRAESYGDIKQTSFKKWRGRIDVLTGGFPCQPFSTAGKRRGANDDRYLWGEMLRCIDEIRPTWFVGENVVGITTMVLPCEAVDVGGQTDLFGTSDHIQESRGRFVLEEICGNLESIGYSVQPLVVPACAVSAPHRRDRIFIVAHDALADTEGCADLRRAREIPCKEGAERLQERHDVLVFGESSDVRSKVQEPIADTCCEGLERRGGTESSAEEGWREADGHLAGSIEECVRKFVIGRWEEFPTQPPLCGGNDGLPFDVDGLSISFGKWRTETLKAYGNAIVPQVILEIFRAIEVIENGN